MNVFGPSDSDPDNVSNTSVVTLVLWVGCLIVGGLGFVLPYARPSLPALQPEPLRVEMLKVELTQNQTPLQSATEVRPAAADPLAEPRIPQPIAVAEPSPALAFAVPVEGPVRVVERPFAAHAKPPATPTPLVPQALTFGEGEGRQPAPQYPARARRDGEEGTVTVRLTVAQDGHVIAAEAVSPSRWPLLNESALETVKQRWHFSPGSLRAYDVSIRFELTR